MRSRWVKLEKDFKTKTGRFDISKIPDIYDCIKYDVQHDQLNEHFAHTEELYFYAKALADIVIPQVSIPARYLWYMLRNPSSSKLIHLRVFRGRNGQLSRMG